MFWGYSPDDLKKEQAQRLVEHLGDPSMDFRVLAFENLRRITGTTLMYHPSNTAARSRSAVQKWQDKLKKGNIVYKNPPPMLPVEPEEVPPPAVVPPDVDMP